MHHNCLAPECCWNTISWTFNNSWATEHFFHLKFTFSEGFAGFSWKVFIILQVIQKQTQTAREGVKYVIFNKICYSFSDHTFSFKYKRNAHISVKKIIYESDTIFGGPPNPERPRIKNDKNIAQLKIFSFFHDNPSVLCNYIFEWTYRK